MSLIIFLETVMNFKAFAAIGAGLAAVGAGIGIGKIGGAAMKQWQDNQSCLLYTSPSPRDS